MILVFAEMLEPYLPDASASFSPLLHNCLLQMRYFVPVASAFITALWRKAHVNTVDLVEPCYNKCMKTILVFCKNCSFTYICCLKRGCLASAPIGISIASTSRTIPRLTRWFENCMVCKVISSSSLCVICLLVLRAASLWTYVV
jgi:hypothetical protein